MRDRPIACLNMGKAEFNRQGLTFGLRTKIGMHTARGPSLKMIGKMMQLATYSTMMDIHTPLHIAAGTSLYMYIRQTERGVCLAIASMALSLLAHTRCMHSTAEHLCIFALKRGALVRHLAPCSNSCICRQLYSCTLKIYNNTVNEGC